MKINYEKLIKNDEIVFEGHPDRLCDIIAEKITRNLTTGFPKNRTAIEMIYNGDNLVVMGEIANPMGLENVEEQIRPIIRKEIKKTGFKVPDITFLWKHQSPEINDASQKGFGDNTIAYGYYNHSTGSQYTPARKRLLDIKERIREKHQKDYIDGKLILIDDKVHISIESGISMKNLIKCGVNGKITIFKKSGGFADTGVVGRKLVASQHGNGIPHGGGAFSGKDITKGDKSLILRGNHFAFKLGQKLKRDVLLQLSCVYGEDKYNIVDLETGEKWEYPLDNDLLRLLYDNHYERGYVANGAHLKPEEYIK